MSDIKLFQIHNGSFQELQGTSVAIEKTLQILIEKNLDALLGVQFLDTEYFTGKTHGGRIDTLGIDENGSPVIIEYKRSLNQNVINQGLFYLDWLMDHKAEFELLVLKRLGSSAADAIDWATPRLLCIANDFTRYDEHAVQQISRNIELIRYRRYGTELLLLEVVNTVIPHTISENADIGSAAKIKGRSPDKTILEKIEQAPLDVQDRLEALKAFLSALGDDVQPTMLKFYIAFRRIKNFACIDVHAPSKRIIVYVKVNPEGLQLEEGFIRNVHSIGHFGTGDLEITIRTDEDLERAKPLLVRSYEVS